MLQISLCSVALLLLPRRQLEMDVSGICGLFRANSLRGRIARKMRAEQAPAL